MEFPDYSVTEEDDVEEGVSAINQGSYSSFSRSAIESEKEKLKLPTTPPKPSAEKRKRGRPRKVKFDDSAESYETAEQQQKASTPPRVSMQTAMRGREILMEHLNGADSDKKRKMLATLKLYYDWFPYTCEGATNRFSGKNTVEEISSEIRRVQDEIGNKDVLQNAYFAHYSIMKGTEQALIWKGVPAHGLTAKAKLSEAVFDQEVKELAIKYDYLFRCGPEMRYAVKWSRMIYETIEENKGHLMGAVLSEMREDGGEDDDNEQQTPSEKKARGILKQAKKITIPKEKINKFNHL